MAFDFIYGADDYLTSREAGERWAAMTKGLDAEFGMEIVDGRCQRVEDVEVMAARFRSACQTLGLFGGARAVWLRGVNFVSDTVVGRAEGTLTILEELKPLLEGAKSDEVKILISATPIDKRLSFFKWLSSNVGSTGNSQEVVSLKGLDPAEFAHQFGLMALEKGLKFDRDAQEMFIKKTGVDARTLENELEKLSTYLNATKEKPQSVDENLVVELTSSIDEGEFFEPVEAFYSRKTAWALSAIRQYWTMRKDADARPLLAAFFNRNRLLTMIKAAEAEGYARVGPRGLNWTSKAESMKMQMGSEKTPFNLFAQHPFYLGKLAQEAMRFSLEELKSMQNELVDIFESAMYQEGETLFEGFFVKHLKAM